MQSDSRRFDSMIDKRTTSSYHPQSNGQVERLNQTLEAILRKIIDDDGLLGEWDTYIQECLPSYNSSRHSTTGVSSCKAVYGHEPRLPTDGNRTAVNDGNDLSHEEFAAMIEKRNRSRQVIHATMMTKIKKAQENMVRYHQRRNAAPEFKVGDKVLLRNENATTGKVVNWRQPGARLSTQ